MGKIHSSYGIALSSLLVIFALSFGLNNFVLPEANAATIVLSVNNFDDPCDDCITPSPNQSINTGDEVMWVNNAGVGIKIVSGVPPGNDGVFLSTTIVPGSDFSYTFNTAGIFDYYVIGGAIFPTGTITVAAADTTPPVFDPLPSPVEEATSASGAVVNYVVTATDDTDPSPVVMCTPVSGSTFALGITPVNCTAEDASGNVANAGFDVEVVDTTAPSVADPPNVRVEATSTSGIDSVDVDLGTPTVIDAVDPAPLVTNDAPETFPLGTTEVHWTATDSSGNSFTTLTQLVTVAEVFINPPTPASVKFDHTTMLSGTVFGWESDDFLLVITGDGDPIMILATSFVGDPDAGATWETPFEPSAATSGTTLNIYAELHDNPPIASSASTPLSVLPHVTSLTIDSIEDVDLTDAVPSVPWDFDYDVTVTLTDLDADSPFSDTISGQSITYSGTAVASGGPGTTAGSASSASTTNTLTAVGAGSVGAAKTVTADFGGTAAYLASSDIATTDITKHYTSTLITSVLDGFGGGSPTPSVKFDYDFSAGVSVTDLNVTGSATGTLDGLTVSYTGPALAPATGPNVAQPFLVTISGDATSASSSDDLTSAGEGSPGLDQPLPFTATFVETDDYFTSSDGDSTTILPHDTSLSLNPFNAIVAGQAFTPIGLLADLDRRESIDTGNVNDLTITFTGNGTSGGSIVLGPATTDDTIIDDPNDTAEIIACAVGICPSSPQALRLGLNSTIDLPINTDTISLELHDIDAGDWVQFNYTKSIDGIEYNDLPTISQNSAPDSVYYSLSVDDGIEQIQFVNASAGITSIIISQINMTSTVDNPHELYQHDFNSNSLGLFETTERFIERGHYHQTGTSDPTPAVNFRVTANFAGNTDYNGVTSNLETYFTTSGGGSSGSGIGNQVDITEDSGTGYTATICGNDGDGDFICNGWEDGDMGYTAGGVSLQFNIPPSEFNSGSSSPSAAIKDIYLEIDKTKGMVILDQALLDVVDAFNNAPVAAPAVAGGVAGINLHIIVDEEIDANGASTTDGTSPPGPTINQITAWKDDNTTDDSATANYDDFKSIKSRNFGKKEWRPTVTIGDYRIFDAPTVAITKTFQLTGLTVTTPSDGQNPIQGVITAVIRADLNTDPAVVSYGAAGRSGTIPSTLTLITSQISFSASPSSASTQKDITVKIPYTITCVTAPCTVVFPTINLPITMNKVFTSATSDQASINVGPNSPTISTTFLDQWAQIAHYVLWTPSIGPCGPSGLAEQLGNDVIVSLGCGFSNPSGFTPTHTVPAGETASLGDLNEQRGTLMHELGHNLNLLHGGAAKVSGAINADAGINCKPPYDSVMSYVHQTNSFGEHTLDYSPGIFINAPNTDLNEATLNENDALTVASTDALGRTMRSGTVVWGVPLPFDPAGPFFQVLSFSAGSVLDINWNGRSGNQQIGVNADINNFSPAGLPACDASPSQVYGDVDDWQNLDYNLRAGIGGSFDGCINAQSCTLDTETEGDGADDSAVESLFNFYSGPQPGRGKQRTPSPDGTTQFDTSENNELFFIFQLTKCDPEDPACDTTQENFYNKLDANGDPRTIEVEIVKVTGSDQTVVESGDTFGTYTVPFFSFVEGGRNQFEMKIKLNLFNSQSSPPTVAPITGPGIYGISIIDLDDEIKGARLLQDNNNNFKFYVTTSDGADPSRTDLSKQYSLRVELIEGQGTTGPGGGGVDCTAKPNHPKCQ